VFIGTGLLDVGLANSYDPAILVGNQLIPRADPATPRTETNRITIQGATVRVTDAVGTQLSTFSSLSSSTVDPGSGTQPGYSVVFATLVDPATTQALRSALPNRTATKTIVAYFKLYGTTLGGTSVESDEFQFPIQVCKGCSVIFPLDAAGHVDCVTPPSTGGGGVPCRPGQDQEIACYYCNGLPACDPTTP
jgi:hypothetical protein